MPEATTKAVEVACQSVLTWPEAAVTIACLIAVTTVIVLLIVIALKD